MPHKGFNKCGRCRKELRWMKNENAHYGIYWEHELRLEILIDKKCPEHRQLKVICPKGHSWISQSKSAIQYIKTQTV